MHGTGLLLVLQGETVWNAAGRLQGQTDIPLSPRGEAQARQVAARLASEPLDAIVASDLQRALHTARVIAARHPSVPLHPDAHLREPSKGVWEGLPWDEVRARFPAQAAVWQADHDAVPEGHEPHTATVARVRSFYDDMRAAHAGASVLVVAHGQILRMLVCVVLGFDPAHFLRFNLGNASISEIRFSAEDPTLHHLNDTSHLAGDDGTQ